MVNSNKLILTSLFFLVGIDPAINVNCTNFFKNKKIIIPTVALLSAYCLYKLVKNQTAKNASSPKDSEYKEIKDLHDDSLTVERMVGPEETFQGMFSKILNGLSIRHLDIIFLSTIISLLEKRNDTYIKQILDAIGSNPQWIQHRLYFQFMKKLCNEISLIENQKPEKILLSSLTQQINSFKSSSESKENELPKKTVSTNTVVDNENETLETIFEKFSKDKSNPYLNEIFQGIIFYLAKKQKYLIIKKINDMKIMKTMKERQELCIQFMKNLCNEISEMENEKSEKILNSYLTEQINSFNFTD